MEARLKESKVVLIRTLISDQLRYINVAREWFTISDLMEIRRRKLGTGRIGGKAAGMLLAMRILEESGDPDIMAACVSLTPTSSARMCFTRSCRSTIWCIGTIRSTSRSGDARRIPADRARF